MLEDGLGHAGVDEQAPHPALELSRAGPRGAEPAFEQRAQHTNAPTAPSSQLEESVPHCFWSRKALAERFVERLLHLDPRNDGTQVDQRPLDGRDRDAAALCAMCLPEVGALVDPHGRVRTALPPGVTTSTILGGKPSSANRAAAAR